MIISVEVYNDTGKLLAQKTANISNNYTIELEQPIICRNEERIEVQIKVGSLTDDSTRNTKRI